MNLDFNDEAFAESYEMAEKLSSVLDGGNILESLPITGEMGMYLKFLSIFNKKYQNKYERNRACFDALAPAMSKRERINISNMLKAVEMKNMLMVLGGMRK